ncbi:hypothetical protein DN745_06030 [Bradymonas sediminis]|uniref:PQQ-binding-like beta-propeller repeat protein n=2 Tax=Bradymonas sediminis TaxID=1548548 RepID=A0A2Z4FJA4_9DELT|nr:hypothetical protein DN745_06030 [Bradymonas sediminis]
MVPMVVDYHGTLFFFIGDIFYAISSEGELLLTHRVDIPEVPVGPGQNLTIADGPANVTGGGWYNTRGAPVLYEDGTILVSFGVSMPGRNGELLRTGAIRVSRSGAVLEAGHFLWKDDPSKRLGMTRLAGVHSGQLALSGRRRYSDSEGIDYKEGAFYGLNNLEPLWNMELPFGHSEESGRDFDEIETDLAIGPNERAFGVTYHGVVYAFDVKNKVGKPIFNFHESEALSWQNRPVIAADGTMYLAYHHFPLGPGVLWAMDTQKLWDEPVPQRLNPHEMPDPDDYEGLKWRKIYSGSGGWSTPVLSKNGRLYEAMGGIGALDPETGEQIWRFGERTMASAPTILSDGTIVVGQGITGRIFFLKEDTPNGGMADEGWPGAMRDHYLSNNAAHPFRWDRSGDAPYPPLEDLLDEAGPCWNEVGWDVDTCGPLPDHSDRDVPGDEDAGAVDEDATSVDAGGQPPSDAAGDVGNDSAPEALGSRGCVGCSASGAAGGPGLLFWGMLFGGAVFWRLLARRLANPISPL